AVLIISGHGSDTFSDNVALFWNLYDSVVTGSRILHDVTEGVGAVSKAIKAIDTFLDTDTERQLEESVAAAIAADECDEASGKESCPANTKKKSKSSNQKSKSKTPTTASDTEMPKFNGCGALGFHIRDSNLPVDKMVECCGVHNTCYSSACRVNKRDCDQKLRNCLFSTCNSRSLDRSLKKSCYAAGKLLFSGTMALSYQQYKDAQEALKCPG
ncbi:Group XII secretory phospholipase A2 precursor, partial [Trinorchestia longiramus]